MDNLEVARILREIGIYLEMDDVPFKPRAYEKAAMSIEGMDEDVEAVYKRGGVKGLSEIPGVGQHIAEKIEELLKTGKLRYYDELKAKVPVDLASLYGIQGLGPKKIKVLWEKLGVKNIDDLEKAVRENKLLRIEGFQEKTEQNILKGIAFARQSKGRYILGLALPLIRDIQGRLVSLPEVKRVEVAGSVRRMKETIGDADILVVSDKPERVMDYFVSMAEVVDVLGKGGTKSSVRLKTGMEVDLRVLPEESFGAGLQYFTGSKDHNVALRRIAQKKGLKLSEYGLFRGAKSVAGRTEEEVYEKLGMEWIPPELRENQGEVEASLEGRLPNLVELKDLKGDLQVHSNWTDGSNPIEEMAEEAKKAGLEYIVISDHSKALGMTGGLDEKELVEQGKEIDRLNGRSAARILKGVELNILKDGSLDISDEVLESMDFVGAAVHTNLNLGKEEMTARVLRAMENPNVDMIYHPTCREIQKREPIQLDLDRVMEAAKRTGTVLDVDSYPDRLDLRDENIRRAKEVGARLGISSDSHSVVGFHFLSLGVAQARRGWATAADIVNTRSAEELLRMRKGGVAGSNAARSAAKRRR